MRESIKLALVNCCECELLTKDMSMITLGCEEIIRLIWSVSGAFYDSITLRDFYSEDDHGYFKD